MHQNTENTVTFYPMQSVAARSEQFLQADGHAMSELIPWLFAWDDSIVLLKDGSLMASFTYAGLDVDSVSNDRLNAERQQLLYAYAQIQEKRICMTWQLRHRRTRDYPDGVFPDPVSGRIDSLLYASFLRNPQFSNYQTVSLVMEPPASATRLLARLSRAQQDGQGNVVGTLKALLHGLKDMVMGNDDFPFDGQAELADAVHDFNQVIDQFAAALASLQIQRLRGEALAGYLTMACSPTTDWWDMPLPDEEFFDSTLPKNWVDNSAKDTLVFSGNEGQKFAQCYTLQLSQRNHVSLTLLDTLLGAPFEFTLSQVFKLLPRSMGERAAASMARYHGLRKHTIGAYVLAGLTRTDVGNTRPNEVRAKAEEEALKLENTISIGQAGLVQWHGTVMVQSDSAQELAVDSAKCAEILQAARLSPIRETLHKLCSFAATIPGAHGHIARWSKVSRENAVDLTPVRTVAHGTRINDYLSEQIGIPCGALLVLTTRYRTPYYFTGYVGDLGHTLMIGPSSTGKTTFCNLAWSQFRKYPGARILGFDKNFSMRPPMVLQGGHYVDLTPENQDSAAQGVARMSPLRALLANGQAEGQAGHFVYCITWLELLAKQRGYRPTATDRITLESVLRAVVATSKSQPQDLRLSSVVTNLDANTELARSLQPWTTGSALGAYFDNEEDHFDMDALTGVEVASLLGNEELAAPFMSYAFYRIATALREMHDNGRVRPTFIYLPEVWYFIKNDTFQDEFFEWLATLRKLCAVLWMDTQSPDQLVQSRIASAFRDNVANYIFTPNRKALTGSLARLYTDEFQLSEEALQAIADGVPKEDYFIAQGSALKRIRLRLDDETMAYLRSDARAQKALERHMRSGDAQWAQNYVRELTTTGGEHP